MHSSKGNTPHVEEAGMRWHSRLLAEVCRVNSDRKHTARALLLRNLSNSVSVMML